MPAEAEILVPAPGCWVRDRDGRAGPVRRTRVDGERTLAQIQLAASDFVWRDVQELRSAFQLQFQVEHVRGDGTASFGVGEVQGVRTLAGCDQVLVQFYDSGRTCWLPFQVLRRAKSTEQRLVRSDVGQHPDHAERFRLRVLAYALQAWDQNTGALGRLDIDPLPHQIHVAHRAVSSGSTNWLIADDVGLGKTIEVGLILHALARRNQCRRVLIVCPAGLVRQWQDELRYKFDQLYEIYGVDFRVPDPVHWRLHEKVIVSLDLAKREAERELLTASGSWDVVIFDEAHRLGRSETGERTERYQLAEALRPLTPSMLLLSGTPHQGKTARFGALLELVRPDLKEQINTLEANPEIVADIVIRNRKARVTDAGGRLLFNGHDTHRVSIEPSPATRRFDEKLQRYLREGYDLSRRGGRMGRAVGFVMTTYRKLASSSIAAITRALERRLNRLRGVAPPEAAEGVMSWERLVEAGAAELDDLAEQGALSDGAPFFDDEAEQIADLLNAAGLARQHDEKLACFIDKVVRPLLARGDSLLVFSEYRATQEYLAARLAATFPEAGVPTLIHGSMSLDDKLASVRRFNDGESRILVSTEAGGEGLNLHRSCYVMVNYDLPWNPSRLVQRIGRLYRYGQTRRVVVFNLQAQDSFDNTAISLMIDRVQTIARDLAAVAGDRRETIEAEILGTLLDNIDLEAILERATGMRIELTELELDAAIAAAQAASRLQEEILYYADGYDSGLSGVAGIDGRHLKSFVESVLPRLGVSVIGPVLRDRALECELPESMVGRFPEFGRRRRITLAFDRQLARDRVNVFPIDFDSSFFRWLIEQTKARGFDGIFARMAAAEANAWIGVYYVRWQNAAGRILDDGLVPVRCNGDGKAAPIAPDEFGRLMARPLSSAAEPVLLEAAHVPASLKAAAERQMAQSVSKTRQPGSAFLLAAASLLDPVHSR